MVAKKYQNPSGGLNARGRAFFKRTEGSNLKSPVKKELIREGLALLRGLLLIKDHER